jgi:hypothetical protein
METNNIEVVDEGVLKIIDNNEVVAIVHHDLKKRSQIFYSCKEMGAEDVKNLLITISKNEKSI